MTGRPFGALVAVDIGNSATKLGVYPGGMVKGLAGASGWCREPTAPSSVTHVATRELPGAVISDWLPASPCYWCVASVHREAQQRLAEWVRQSRCEDAYALLAYRDLPIAIEVDAPERVGVDRLAAAVGANLLRTPHRRAIVVDLGTALKVDLVSADGAFQGGAILPGIAMAGRALAKETDALPLVEPIFDGPPPAVGKSTIAAIRSGLFWGAVGAIRELAARMGESADDGGAEDGGLEHPEMFFTGGGGELAVCFGADARFSPHLVLSGIALAAQGVASERGCELT